MFTPTRALRAVPPPVVRLDDETTPDRLLRPDVVSLTFERRCRRTATTAGRHPGGYWRSLMGCVPLHCPPVSDWTATTLAQVIAHARDALVAHGARGRCRITARVDSPWRVNVVDLAVRVGDWRTRIRIDAGCHVFEVPLDLLTTLARLDPQRTTAHAVRCAQEAQEELA